MLVKSPLLLVFLAGCAIERVGTDPPLDDLYYPTGVAAHGDFAYVVNANTDLRYNSATVVTVDLNQVDINSEFNQQAIIKDSTQRIESYGAVPVLNANADRMFIASRQNNVLFSFDVNGGSVKCGETGRNRFTSCDDAHVFQLSGKVFSDELTDNDTSQPFVGATAAPLPGLPGEYLFLTHLNAGAISVYDITKNSLTNPTGFTAVSLLGKDRLGAAVNGTSAIGVAQGPGRRPTIYAGANRVLSVKPPGAASTLFFFDPRLAFDEHADAGTLPLARYLGGTTASIDVKYIVASPDGSRTYFLTKEPNTLVELDSSLDENGHAKNTFVHVVALERSPGTMIYVRMPDGRDRIYVSCFGDGSILVYDAASLAMIHKISVKDTPHLERGPYSLAVAYQQRGPLVLAAYFNDDALMLFDPTSNDDFWGRVGSPRGNKK